MSAPTDTLEWSRRTVRQFPATYTAAPSSGRIVSDEACFRATDQPRRQVIGLATPRGAPLGPHGPILHTQPMSPYWISCLPPFSGDRRFQGPGGQVADKHPRQGGASETVCRPPGSRYDSRLSCLSPTAPTQKCEQRAAHQQEGVVVRCGPKISVEKVIGQTKPAACRTVESGEQLGRTAG